MSISNHDLKARARLLKEILIELSPLIERYTGKICPGCDDVCCRERHGMTTETDIACFAALGIEPPPRKEGVPLDGPCYHLGLIGCSMPRWRRAWKCTWFFCEPLLNSMNEGDRETSRRITELIKAAMALREEIRLGVSVAPDR